MTEVEDQPQTTPAPAGDAEREALGAELMDTVVTVLGTPPGQRGTHHKGIVLAGTFTATPRARGAEPGGPPAGRAGSGHGPVLQRLPQYRGARLHLRRPARDGGQVLSRRRRDHRTGLPELAGLPAATPEQFRDLLRAQHEGVEATEAFLADNPNCVQAGDAAGCRCSCC